MDGYTPPETAAAATGWRAILPQQLCLYCRSHTAGGSLCHACRKHLRDQRPRCNCCAYPLPPGSTATRICGECLKHPPAFTRVVTASDYSAPIDRWINRFKHRRDLRDGQLLTRLLIERLLIAYDGQPLPELLVPVPLHWWRQLRRSFNQACWISHCLQQQLAIPARHALVRHRASHTQQGLDRSQRQQNLKGVYRVSPRQRHHLHDRHLALVDDVVTTTATARTLSALLLQAGARRIDVWCLARTARTHTELDR